MGPNSALEGRASSLAGKVIFITGGTAGLGSGSVTALAEHDPAHIIFSGRNQKSADALIAAVGKASQNTKLSFIKCDISSLESVCEAASRFRTLSDSLDILMLNAGVMAIDAAVSIDGYELQFATNYLGHALLVKLLLPILEATARTAGSDVRIISMTSIAYQQAPKQGIDLATLKSPQLGLGSIIPGGKWSRYGQSKLAQLLYARELAERYPTITSVAIHPGIILTGLFENVNFGTKLPVLLMSIGKKTPVEEGHLNQCWAATCDKSRIVSGEYYEPVGIMGRRTTKPSNDRELQRRLWDWTEKELQRFTPSAVA